jgi:hypothetical protein
MICLCLTYPGMQQALGPPDLAGSEDDEERP